MQCVEEIAILRQLNYELVRELGLFTRRGGLSFTQRHTLYHIKNNTSLSIQELAEIMHVEHSTMSRNIKKLVDEGMVIVSADTIDKRRKSVYLSSKGNENLEIATESIDRMLAKALQAIDKEDINLIISGIRKYILALQKKN